MTILFPFINWMKSAKSSSENAGLRNQPTSMNILNDLIDKGDDFKLYGEEMKQSFDRQYILKKFFLPSFYNKLFVLLQCTSLAFYTIDVGLDVWLAYNYSHKGEMLFFWTNHLLYIAHHFLYCLSLGYQPKFNDGK